MYIISQDETSPQHIMNIFNLDAFLTTINKYFRITAHRKTFNAYYFVSTVPDSSFYVPMLNLGMYVLYFLFW